MNNVTIILTYSVFALGMLLLFLLPFFDGGKKALDRNFQFVASMLFVWQIVLILYFACDNIQMCKLLFNMPLPFAALTSLAWFLYIIRFYRLESYFPRAVVAALFVVPVFTFVMCATSLYHGMVRSELEIIQTQPLHIDWMVRGPWFWYHAMYCYLLIFVAFCIVLYQHVKLLKAYRSPSTMLLLSLSITMAGNIAVVATNFVLDVSLLLASASTLLLYFATKNNQSIDYLLQARREVFHYIKQGITVTDNDEEIVNMNRTARQWLDGYGVVLKTNAHHEITEQMADKIIKQQPPGEDLPGTDYYFADGRIINIRKKPILDKQSKPIGTFIIGNDVGENRSMIDFLENVAGQDTLTGLANLRQFHQDKRSMDREEDYPLAFISGDLNYLKQANDQLGHHQGDIYIRAVAESLKSVCPPSARIARTGGDEFGVLIPRYTRKQTEVLMQNIKAAVSGLTGYLFKPSIALGCAVKEAAGQNLDEIIAAADQKMYGDKYLQKTGRAEL